MNCAICDALLIESYEKDSSKCGECWRREAEAMCADFKRLRAEVEHWRVKAECYGGMVHGITPALAEAGFPVEEFAKDGNLGAIPRAVSRMAAEVKRLKGIERGWLDFAKHIERAQAILSGGHLGKNVLEAALDEVERLLLENRLLRECLLGVQLKIRCLVDGPEGELLEMCDVPWEEVFREKMAAALSPRKEG